MSGLTDTQLKLRDAGIQMKLALRHAREEDVFRSCINSFLAASRSVTMTMERESKHHSQELLAWYKARSEGLGEDPLFKFFKAQREHTIHRGVVRPKEAKLRFQDYRASWIPAEPGGAKKEINFTIQKADMPELLLRPGDVLHTTVSNEAIYWEFVEAKAMLPDRSANVFRLCEDYFVVLKGLVHAWLARMAELDSNDSRPD